MQSHYTIDTETTGKYEYPKSPFVTMQECVEAHEQLKANTVPALWTGNRIIPYSYDLANGTVAAEAICEYCYELPEDWRIRGGAFILLTLNHAESDTAVIFRHLYPYFDKSLAHAGVYRVVQGGELTIPSLKVDAPEGYVFHQYRTEATTRAWTEEFLGEKCVEMHKFRVEIVDKYPDQMEEIINDVLMKDMVDAIDSEILQKMLEQET